MLTKLTGLRGEVRIVNQVAAQLGAWTLVPGTEPGTKVITATMVSKNAFLLAQAPDVVIVHIGASRARWRITRLETGGSTVTVTVTGAPEVRT